MPGAKRNKKPGRPGRKTSKNKEQVELLRAMFERLLGLLDDDDLRMLGVSVDRSSRRHGRPRPRRIEFCEAVIREAFFARLIDVAFFRCSLEIAAINWGSAPAPEYRPHKGASPTTATPGSRAKAAVLAARVAAGEEMWAEDDRTAIAEPFELAEPQAGVSGTRRGKEVGVR